MQPPIFLINMPSSINRFDAMAKQLDTLRLRYERFEATVGTKLTQEDLSLWYDPVINKKLHHRNLTLGEIGCYISHKRIWQRMVDEQIPSCIILEDGTIVDTHLVDSIDVINSMAGWDVIKLSDNRTYPFIDSQPCKHRLSVGNYLKVPNGAQGYAVSLEGAHKLISRGLFFRPIDVDLQFHSEIELRLFGLKPYPIREDYSFESDIVRVNAGRHNNHSTAFRNIKFRLRMYFQRKKISGNVNVLSQT